MNRVLSWPYTPMVPGLLKPLKTGRSETVVTERGTVRFDLPLGPVEMGFLAKDQELPPGTPVYVWWKGGGFLCASIEEMHAEEFSARTIAERVSAARAKLQEARRERNLRAGDPSGFGALTPETTSNENHPLLQL
jgi:hypothetical protein